eukprot:2428218-Karenia_brevis.AAC.1
MVAEARSAVADPSFSHFRMRVVNFMEREGRPPSKKSNIEEERRLAMQVSDCFRGHRKLDPEQVEELRACLRVNA